MYLGVGDSVYFHLDEINFDLQTVRAGGDDPVETLGSRGV